MPKQRGKLFANLMLVLAAIIWGASFSVMKDTLDTIPVNTLLAIRFSVGAIGLGFALIKFRHELNLKAIMRGAALGLVLFLAFMLQTIGLSHTTAGENAFITSVYVVLVPLFMWFIKRRKPKLITYLAALTCLLGIGVLTFSSGAAGYDPLGYGITLAAGVLFALHISLVEHFTDAGERVLPITCLQFLFAAIFAWIASALFETIPNLTAMPGQTWLSIGYVSVFATLAAFLMQNFGIAYVSASNASITMCLEAPFGYLFGVVLLGEPLQLSTLAGCGIIIAGLIMSQLDVLRTKKDPANNKI